MPQKITNSRLPLGLRVASMMGFVLAVEGVYGPSGKLYRSFPTEASARDFLRRVTTGLVQEAVGGLEALRRCGPPVKAFASLADQVARDPKSGEEDRATTILAWLTVETLGVTWEQITPEGLS